MIEFTITLTGDSLLMHNSRLANPLDPIVKEIKRYTGKRKKTDEDHETIARLEHAGGLYIDPDVGPYIPGDNIMRCLFDAAKLTKQGAAITRGLFIKTDVNPLAYKGPRTTEELWTKGYKHMASVKVGTQRVMRCRPWFTDWATEAIGILDPSVLELDDIGTIANNAGQMIGLCEWRNSPRHGRFTATVTQNA